MAISSYQVYLGVLKEGTTYSKLVDIKSFPDLGGEPELIDTTTLSDSMQTNIAGILSVDTLEFLANYEKEKFAEIKSKEGKPTKYAIFFGENGVNGIYGWTGDLRARITGAEVNAVVEMAISCVASTPIEAIESATLEQNPTQSVSSK